MAALTGDRIVDEQAALRRVATLVAGAAGPEEVFGAVAAEVGQLLPVDFTVLIRSDHPAGWSRAGCGLSGVLARRSAVPVRLYVQTTTRYPEPIEMTAYYVVSEGLANAAKHAAATVLDVRVTDVAGRLRVRVRDDGRGGADVAHGSGIVGLTDRVEALAGRLVLDSPAGAGTVLEVDLPLEE